jgi:hypothetical protein
MMRFTKEEDPEFAVPTGDGETLSGALRVGTALGSNWGVELEFARGAGIDRESRFSPDVRILATEPSRVATVPVGVIFPPVTVEYRYRLQQQHATFSPVAWVRQFVGSKADLAYMGGVAFTRTSSTLEFSATASGPFGLELFPSSQLTRHVAYVVGPLAGFEARFALTEHARLSTGVRIQGLSGVNSGWLLRSSAGLGWVF